MLFYWIVVCFAKNHSTTFTVTGRICPKGNSVGIVFTHGPIFGFFAQATRYTDQGEIWQGGADRV